jgi:hypothetical protein
MILGGAISKAFPLLDIVYFAVSLMCSHALRAT